MESKKRLRSICYCKIVLSFAIIWLDWVLLLANFDLSKCDGVHVTIFGAGSLFGYVPLLTGVATLKKHGARRGLLLATAISSVILAVYDFSEAIAVFDCNKPMGVLFAVQGGLSAFIIILAGVAWISIGWWNEPNQTRGSSSTESTNTGNVSGQNDAPPNYTRAIRDPDSIIVRVETSIHRRYHRLSEQLNLNSFRTPLFIPGRNLERLSMGISINTIGIVVLQVVVEVLRVSARTFKFEKPYNQGNQSWTMWCNEDIDISCIAGLGYYCTMPPFFLIIFGIQFRVTRRGLNIPGWFGAAYALFSFLTFLTLTALAMMDFVVLIGMITFNELKITSGSQSTATTILVSAESLTVIQALLSIACAALAMVASYILSTQIIEKNRRTQRRHETHQNNSSENNTEEAGDQGIENVAYETDENESISDPKLPSYSMASNMLRRHNSLPNLLKLNRFGQLPGVSSYPTVTIRAGNLRRTNSTNLFDHNPEEPPPYSRDHLY